MKYKFGKFKNLYGDFRDWFIVDDSFQKYPFEFYANTTYIGTLLIPIDKESREVELEIHGECISAPQIIRIIRYKCKELNKEGNIKICCPKKIDIEDSIIITVKLRHDILKGD